MSGASHILIIYTQKGQLNTASFRQYSETDIFSVDISLVRFCCGNFETTVRKYQCNCTNRSIPSRRSRILLLKQS